MSKIRYFNWGGKECWAIDFALLPARPKKDDVVIIFRPARNEYALVDFDELKNLHMHDTPEPVLDQIEGES